jgi:hypothetical protein
VDRGGFQSYCSLTHVGAVSGWGYAAILYPVKESAIALSRSTSERSGGNYEVELGYSLCNSTYNR